MFKVGDQVYIKNDIDGSRVGGLISMSLAERYPEIAKSPCLITSIVPATCKKDDYWCRVKFQDGRQGGVYISCLTSDLIGGIETFDVDTLEVMDAFNTLMGT